MISIRVFTVERGDAFGSGGVGTGRSELADVAFTIPDGEVDDLATRVAMEPNVPIEISANRLITVKRRSLAT